jgi:hypothetical protein
VEALVEFPEVGILVLDDVTYYKNYPYKQANEQDPLLRLYGGSHDKQLVEELHLKQSLLKLKNYFLKF